ncbi:glycosyltransferase, partial [Microbacterium indicum]|uniref:glycosyltransferase n=1 Tax=Microbacterium indicum TaxID=358100 RepID=UPI000684C42D
SDGVLHPVAREKLRDDELERTPLLSVVMPVYNVGQFLDTAIRSVLTQDLTNLELIIIDDASSDNSRQVIEMHRALDPRIKVIELDHNTLGGAGVPSNLGIRAARGKYLAFVDSDDWVKAGIFSKLVELADQNNAQLVVGDFRTFNDTDRDIVDAYDNAAWRDIPLGEVISAYTHPALLRLSAVPWRKLYRRDLLTENHILYPEGDYFYEDNPLHWFVLSRADRVVATDDVISYHRMEREGQTMGASEYKLGAVTAHANTIFNFLAATEHDGRDLLFEEFFAYLSRVKWTIKRQQQPAAARLIEHRLSHIYKRAVAAAPGVRVPDEIRMQFEEYAGAYPDIDLTVVMPVYNSADLLRSSLDSVLRLSGISFDVLLVDDGSSDDSLKIMREYEQKHANVHAFTQGNRGAGRARNSVIPLVAGRYAFFLDSDDVIDASALEKAVAHADVTGSDLTFVKYQVDYIDEKKVKGMFARDVEAWEKLPLSRTNAERQAFTANMINYPWTRIISTDLLHDANVFFGPTVVHNDVLYHWHSVMAATNIGFYDAIVCSHRKFKERDQVTNIKDARRMAVLEALRGTNKRISDLESYDNGREAWQTFSLKLLDWALDLIPAELRKTYQDHAETLAAEIRD